MNVSLFSIAFSGATDLCPTSKQMVFAVGFEMIQPII